MELVLLGGFGFVLGAAVALVFASSARRFVMLLAGGIVLAAAYFALAWLTAPASADEADYSCSDCGQWLGRWWEGELVLLIDVFNLVGWWVGVLAGAGLKRLVFPARTRPV